MAYSFGDGFDHYTLQTDPGNGYWDSAGVGAFGLTTGRIAGQAIGCLATGGNSCLTKASGANDAVHHINVAFWTSNALTGSSGIYDLQLQDGVTSQCSIVFRTDGALLLTTGGPAGATLATYLTAVTATNAWFGFEIEVVINNTTGSFRVRKNGNTSDDHVTTGINTRGGTANNYANKLFVHQQNGLFLNGQKLDDILWRSDASSVAFVGDIRCYTRMPVSDASAQFARSAASVVTVGSPFNSVTVVANEARYTPFTPTVNGTIATIAVNVNAPFTGNMKCALFSDASGFPGAVLGSATPITNPVSGNNTMTFATPVAVTKGVQHWWGVILNATGVVVYVNNNSGRNGTGVTYAAFPASTPAVGGTTSMMAGTITVVPTVNADFVNEAQQDGTTSYVYDSVVGHGDLYNLAPLGSTPSSIVMVTTLGFMEKSDTGARGAAMQLRSGANLIASTTWNPADKSAGTTLSNGNLTAALGGQNGVRGVFGQNANKYYFEITATAIGSNTAIGLANPSCNIDILGIGGAGAVNVVDTGFAYMNNSGTSVSIGAIANGAIICIAVDLTNQLIWFKNGVAGNWNGTAGFSPGGTGGLAFTAALGGAGGTLLYPVVSSYSGGANFTANFGATAFAGTVPAGFSSGFGAQSGGTTVQSTATLLSTSFTYLYRNDVLNPNGSIPWTAAAVDALQFGPVVVS